MLSRFAPATRLACLSAVAVWLVAMPRFPASAADFTLLFMGDNGPHQPARRFQELAPELEKRGIELRYTERMDDLNRETLAAYDGLVLYANIDTIEPEQAAAVLKFVADGKGFVPLHCASYCWRNSPEMVALMGGQFQRHGTGIFSTEIARPEHPVMQGFGGFSSWDETYIHHLHNEQNRTVLEYRGEGEQAENRAREPWTWVRTHGNGRVFYTAWGHDARTFTNPGFVNLVERGIRWACGGDPGKAADFRDPERFDVPAMTALPSGEEPFQYVDVGPKIPNYTPSRQWGTQGDPITLMQKPLSPEESIKRFVTPENMIVRRYADERAFQAKPIALTWDEQGRLWVCETVDYPNELGKNRDRIRICEDTDGDHVADKFTVFAEGLSIPTTLVIVRGGAVVQNGPETIYLKDTNGDDVADQRTTLITGWALGDTHGGVSNFRYGLDNWIWAMQGYNNSSPRYLGPDGEMHQAQSFRQGFWRFKLSQTDPPRVTDLEFIRSSDNNTWGLGISEEGLIFGSTANHNPSMFMPIPNRYYERVRGWAPSTLHTIADSHRFDPITDKVRQVDHHGGYTAAAGHALYTARAFPEQWWNRTAFVCGPTGHLVGTFVLRREGADYSSTSPLNLLASDDEWSAPVMAEVGPDGAVWVIDWYNYIVQHNPTPQGFETGKGAAYESDLRDKKHGRIYRVVATEDDQEQLHAFASLAAASAEQLVEQLQHPSFVWRLHAQRLLIEREAREAIPALVSLVQDESVDALGLNVGAIHALHTLDGLGWFAAGSSEAAELLASGIAHRSPGVRRAALALLPVHPQGLDVLMNAPTIFGDEDAQVRLQALLTLADMPASDRAGRLVALLVRPELDDILLDGFTAAAAAHADGFLRAIAELQEPVVSQGSRQLIGRVAEHVARGRPDADRLQRLLDGLARSPAPLAVAALDGLTEGLPSDFRVVANTELDQAFVAAFDALPAEAKVKLLRVAAQCNTRALESYADEIVDALVDLLGNEDAAAEARVAAARDLIGFRAAEDEAVEEIVAVITPQTSPQLGAGLLGAIAASESATAGEVVLDALSGFTPSVKNTAISLLLGKPAWARTLLAAAEQREFDLNELSLEQKQSLRSYPDAALQKRAEALLAMGGGLPDADREKVLQSLMHLTEQTGNVDAGRAVFKKVCAACHKHGDIGHKIGPDLTGMAVHPKSELLVHIIDPSRNVEGNYRLYNVLTIDGQVINGMLAGESRTSITIVDSQGKTIDVARDEIEELIASRQSVMPEGFEKQISQQELADLLEFLTDKGRFVPLPLDRAATAISTKGLFHDGDDGPDRMVFSDWNAKVFENVPFVLTDPEGKSRPNIILLHGPNGSLPPKMPRSVTVPVNSPAAKIHLLSGVGGWNYPYDRRQTVSMIVRLHYADGRSEDHPLRNGVHFADYIRRVDVPQSQFAFELGDQQIRYLNITPRRDETIERLEFVKGEDNSAPIIMAVTIENASAG
ncbi:PVC-type heme-binding CxxCH protein [Roseimaritima sediminicola]|uniref:PVC-type heme-binding CxxCH protein n=1 Tax=Roseimaritima sediminicola TaxID=2662066 RepID=UPI0012985436|nr:PVC-type heme-binding CxxCH protein [Roseimaritima sediminicola]